MEPPFTSDCQRAATIKSKRKECSPVITRTLSLIFLVYAVASGAAQVHLPNIFSEHGILQRDRPTRIWGTSSPGETIVIKIHAQQIQTRAADSGHWEALLAPEPAGGPYELEVDGHSNKVVLADILFGDVFLVSGQSNIGYSFAGIQDSVMPHAQEVLAAADDPDLRILRVPKDFGPAPREDQPTRWARCTPQSVAEFSLLGYLTGRALSDREHVPVGIIQAAYGGTPIEGWVSAPALQHVPTLQAPLAQWAYDLDQEVAAKATSGAQGVLPPIGLRHPVPGIWRASTLFNGMISPIAPYTIKGVIWYQGESSADPSRAAAYEDLLTTLIGSWRTLWHDPQLPFVVVQISSFIAGPKMQWGTVREAQRRILKLPDTALVVTYDLGFAHNPHPPQKQETADRIVLACRGLFYGEKIESSGPLFLAAETRDSSIRVSFTHNEGLHASGHQLQGFEIAAADGRFAPATARVVDNAVIVSSSSVPHPTTVRYAWANFTDANLYNGANLPAATFTTDSKK
jgi:sialate O-acetylesterase